LSPRAWSSGQRAVRAATAVAFARPARGRAAAGCRSSRGPPRSARPRLAGAGCDHPPPIDIAARGSAYRRSWRARRFRRRGRARALGRAGPRVAARAAAPSDPAMPLDGGNRGRSDASTANIANRSRHCPGGGPECRRRCGRRRRPRARQRRPSRPRQHRNSGPSRAGPRRGCHQRGRRLVPVGRAVSLGRIRRRRRVLACDSGTIATWAARHQTIRGGRGFFLSGSPATTVPGMRYAIGMQQVFPGRQVIAYAGHGGFAMLMAEFFTEIQHQLPVKVVINNDSPGQMLCEQMLVGYPQQGVRYPKSVRELRGTRRSQRRTRHQGGTSGRGPRRRPAGAQTAVLVLQRPERRRSDCAQSTPKLNASSSARWARTLMSGAVSRAPLRHRGDRRASCASSSWPG